MVVVGKSLNLHPQDGAKGGGEVAPDRPRPPGQNLGGKSEGKEGGRVDITGKCTVVIMLRAWSCCQWDLGAIW